MATCRGCRKELGAAVVPGFYGIGSLFGDEEANSIIDGLFCESCKGKHKGVSTFNMLDCGHHSILHNDQMGDEMCYYPTCSEKSKKPQTEDDDCIFCSEPLASEPCVVFGCGHLFHYWCMQTYLEDRSSKNAPVSITNTFCPLCKAEIKWEGKRYTSFDTLVQNAKAVRVHLEALSEAQIIKDASIPDMMPANPLEYGMSHFKFYRCSKCSSVYYGGKRECGEDDIEAADGELLCGGCRGCAKHGDEYMSYKCRFCCKEALWFCFGHTHFCDGCHGINGELAGGAGHHYLVRKLYVCGGKDKCPLGVDHPPHGQEFALRCTACVEDAEDEFGREITALYGPFVERVDVLAANAGLLDMLFGEYDPQLVYGDLLVEEGEVIGLDFLFYEDEWLAEFEHFALFDDENDLQQQPQLPQQPVAVPQAPEHLHPALDPQFEGFDIFESSSSSSLSTPTPSRLNKLFYASKAFFHNWPQFVVVAAAAAFLNNTPIPIAVI